MAADQAAEINFTVVLYAGIMYTGLVVSGWLLMRLTIACFKLPSVLNAKQFQEEIGDDEIQKAYKMLTEEHADADGAADQNRDARRAPLEEEITPPPLSPSSLWDDTTILLPSSEGETRGRKRNSGKRTKAVDVISAEAELITKGLNNSEDVDGRRTTRSSTRGSTAASKLKSEPPAKKEKKTPAVKGGRRGRAKVEEKEEENEGVVSAEENGVAETDVDSKADKGGSSTEADSEVDSQSDEKVENGNSSTEEEKNIEESAESADESEMPDVVVKEKTDSSTS